jgi:hypothetical protein
MLIEMLKRNPSFSSLSLEKQEAFAALANEFEDNEFALYLDPNELTAKLGLGNKTQWQEFLSMEPVRQYINGQMAFNSQVATRKTFASLVQNGMRGDTQAVKQINEMSGILNSGDKNRIVVLHQISRSKVVRKE